MIHIKYKLETSPLHGIGLYADEYISKGALIYTASPLLDLNISEEQFDMLDEKEKQEVRWWGFSDPVTGAWHVDFDVTRFINHSLDATVAQDPSRTDAYLVAVRNIEAGEELTQNYLEFESEEDLRARGIVPKK
jgi:uncharacterized protein